MSKAENATSPLRTCIGCRRQASPADLFRCALVDDGRAVVSRTAPGRGAWICDEACLEAALRHKRFGRAFRGPVPDDLADRLREALAAARRGGGTGAV